MLRNMALKDRNRELAQLALDYITVHSNEWSQKVSFFALRTMNNDKQNKAEVLPLTDDIVKLSKFLVDEVKKRSTEYEEECTSHNYNQLVDVTLAQLICFNKRHSEERVELQQYARMPEVIGLGNAEFFGILSDR